MVSLFNDQYKNNRYSIQEKLGQGGSSITYTAIDQKSNQQVALKALSLTGLEDWKKIELFEREGKILQQLNHPAIPKYLDYFKIETEDDVYFYIAQQLAPGKSLAHLISEGWQPGETTIKNIAEQILEILVYLQQLTPPVIHRDLKPQNIIYQPDTGKLFLVDFGAVQDTYHHTVMGSTVVGTYGYMAPEQYRGGAVLSTDLYSLGCTLLFLLTGESPAELPQKKLKIDFRSHVNIKRDFANWIDKLIEPNINYRFPRAEAALLVLQEKKSIEDYQDNAIVKPRYSSIKIIKDQEKIIIYIPPAYQQKYFYREHPIWKNLLNNLARINNLTRMLGFQNTRENVRWKNGILPFDKSYYFWIAWSILSIFNITALFFSAALFFKILLATWFFIVTFAYDKKHSLIMQYLFLISIRFFGNTPSFATWLFFINTILELFSNHNHLITVFFKTRIILFNKRRNLEKRPNSVFVRQMIIEKKVINIWQIENIQYLSPNKSLPNNFLTVQEKKWLHSEIWGNKKL